MLRLRRAELEEEARAVGTRLAAVESRVRMIQKENTISPDYVVKTLPAVRLVGRRAVVDPEVIGQHVGPMFEELSATLRHVDGALATPIATYAEVDESMEVAVGYTWGGPAPDGTEAIDQAAGSPLQQPVTR